MRENAVANAALPGCGPKAFTPGFGKIHSGEVIEMEMECRSVPATINYAGRLSLVGPSK